MEEVFWGCVRSGAWPVEDPEIGGAGESGGPGDRPPDGVEHFIFFLYMF